MMQTSLETATASCPALADVEARRGSLQAAAGRPEDKETIPRVTEALANRPSASSFRAESPRSIG